jgi:uncharacterized protein with von Willebrand factor type A (vWA) domain
MKDFTHITILLDSSGSMAPLTNDVIGGYNTFIQNQQELGDNASISVYTFSDTVSGYTFPESIKSARFLTRVTYQPCGGTALFDALMRSINDTGSYLSSINEDERPNKVIFAIITDGEENASKLGYTKEQVASTIKQQQELYSWEFVFIGANQDSFSEAANLGISNSINFCGSAAGVRTMYDSLASTVTAYRAR